MKKILMIGLGAFALVASVMIARTTLLFSPTSPSVPPRGFSDASDAATRLAQAITFRTVTIDYAAPLDASAFEGFQAFLAEAYPAAHRVMEREIIGAHSLIYRWPGADASLKPIALLAHQDVVPVEPGTEDRWTHPPFDGVIDGGMVWGRGALDNKGQLIAIMEAAEKLAASGFQPTRDIYFLFGHDEELGGEEGARRIAETLKARGVPLAMTLDEGSGVVDNLIPGAARPLALVATAEKGSVTLRFTARAEGGHSSAPAKDTAVSLVSRAVVAVTDHPHPLKMDRNVVDFLHGIAPETPFMQRLMLSNLWITGGLVKSSLAKNPTTAASLHTTTAPTIISGGVKLNVLPQNASAIVNYRIHPRDTVDGVVERARRLIDDERVEVEVLSASEPSPRASQASDEYAAIEASIGAVFGPISIAPSLTLQGTDTKHFTALADNNYRFTPFIHEPDDLKRMHGDDERIRIIDLARGIAWYENFLTRAAGASGD